MKKIENKDEAGEKWPETVEVSIKQGKEHTEVTWTKRKDKNDFQNGGHFLILFCRRSLAYQAMS